MSRLIPPEYVTIKLAALKNADAVARERADYDISVEMAKHAGISMARRRMSPELEAMLKEAGIFSRIGGAIAKKLKRPPKLSKKPTPGSQAKQMFKTPTHGQSAGGAVKKAPAPAKKKPFRLLPAMWKHRGALGAAGVLGAGYGGVKGLQWGARQLEQTSNSPLAQGGGWSPTPYGYGYSPYGSGSPTMGYGA